MLDGESQRPGLGCTTPSQVEKGLVPALIGSYWREDNILLGITQRILLQKQLEWAGDLSGGLIFFVRREPSNDRSVGDTGKKNAVGGTLPLSFSANCLAAVDAFAGDYGSCRLQRWERKELTIPRCGTVDTSASVLKDISTPNLHVKMPI
jgi:hypothetical protein